MMASVEVEDEVADVGGLVLELLLLPVRMLIGSRHTTESVRSLSLRITEGERGPHHGKSSSSSSGSVKLSPRPE